MRRPPCGGEAQPRSIQSSTSPAAPRLLVRKIIDAREIDFAVVAQRQNAFVQDAQQQIPQAVGSLLDFIEQHEAELKLVSVVPVQFFLRQ